MRLLCVLVLTTFAACGGGSGKSPDGSTDGTGGGDAGDCEADSSLTASGAFSGTRTAPAAAASHGTANDTGAVLVSAQFGTPFLSSWSFTFTGAPGPTTYTDSTPGLGCAATVADSANPTDTWIASKGVQGTPDQGTCALTLTSVTPTLMLSAQTQYCVHGTMQATLQA